MPPTKVMIYREADGGVPLRDWLDDLHRGGKLKIVDKINVRIGRLKEQGYELCSGQGRGEAAHLRDGIYELRKLGEKGRCGLVPRHIKREGGSASRN